MSLETQLVNTNSKIKKLKKKRATCKTQLNSNRKTTQKDQAEAFDHITECEQQQANQDNELIRQEIYNQRWNTIFYKVPETRNENCTGLVQKILIYNLKIKREEVNQLQFCRVHHNGKQSRQPPRPIIARFTCQTDRDNRDQRVNPTQVSNNFIYRE